MDFDPLSLSDRKKRGCKVQGGCKKIRYKRFYAMIFSVHGLFPGGRGLYRLSGRGKNDDYRPFYAMIRETFSLYAL